jgi:hypothetical protein
MRASWTRDFGVVVPRVGRTFACLILASALILAAGQASARTEAARGVSVEQMSVAYQGSSALLNALSSGDARSRALARTDFDADGAQDLVVGYAWHGAGLVTLQRGSPDAFAPKRQSVFARMQRGDEIDLMASGARVARVPEPVAFVEAGDFNRDGRADVLAGSLGGGLYLLAGDGRGGVGPARRIRLGGTVTTLAAGEFRAADGRRDVAVGVATRTGSQLLLYDSAARGLRARPLRFSLPGRATAIQFGGLDADPFMDVAVAADGRLEIVHGWGRKRSPEVASRVERVGVSGVRGISIGHFLRDRGGLNEIAAALGDGTVRLVIPGNIDRRPLTAKDI